MRLMFKNCHMASIDLKNAYFLWPVRQKCRKLLRFHCENIYYEFTCIPFGLSTAPFTFTKLTKPVIAFLRKRGVLCLVYLDDFLILGNSEQKCRKNVKLTVSLLESLGLLVNCEKSCLQPKQT